MSGSVDIGFGGSGGGAAAGGASTFSTLSVGPGPYASAGDIRLGPSGSIYAMAGSANMRAMAAGGGNFYFGDSTANSVGFALSGGGVTFYAIGNNFGTGIQIFNGQIQAGLQTVQTTAPAAGAAAALPATPKGYWSIQLNGSIQLIPYY